MSYQIRPLAVLNGERLAAGMRQVGADPVGIQHMLAKSQFYALRGDHLSLPAALILKQEALSKGAEVVIHRSCIVSQVESTSFLLLATGRQLEEINRRLVKQAFGLPRLAQELAEAVDHLACRVWEVPYEGGCLALGRRTLVMGIINVTPDSFSDGGRYLDPAQAIAYGRELAAAGADLLDIGGASSRPGFTPVPVEEERERVLPVVRGLAGLGVPLSIDSDQPPVVAAALAAGAAIINDIGGLQNPEMLALAAERQAPVVVMHQGADADDLMGEMISFFRRTMERAAAAGLGPEKIILDPGLGFGKDTGQNLEILRYLADLRVLGRPVLLGTSRKKHIGEVLHLPVDQREEGTAATLCRGIEAGAAILRVHQVETLSRVVRMADALQGRWPQ